MPELDLVLEHPHFVSALGGLADAALPEVMGEGRVVVVPGASRSGKTVLKEVFRRVAVAHSAKSPRTPPDGVTPDQAMPFIFEEAAIQSDRSFKQQTLWRKLLRKLLPLSNADSRDVREADLSDLLATALRNRCTQWVFLDEAHHLLYMRPTGRGRDADDARRYQRMEALKSVVNASGATFILAGNPDLMQIYDLSEQLAARSETVPLHLYSANSEEEFHQFCHWAEKVLDSEGIALKSSECEQLFVGYAGSIGKLYSRIVHLRSSTRLSVRNLLDRQNMLEVKTRYAMRDSDEYLRQRMAESSKIDVDEWFNRKKEATPPVSAATSSVTSVKAPKKNVGRKIVKRESIANPLYGT